MKFIFSLDIFTLLLQWKKSFIVGDGVKSVFKRKEMKKFLFRVKSFFEGHNSMQMKCIFLLGKWIEVIKIASKGGNCTFLRTSFLLWSLNAWNWIMKQKGKYYFRQRNSWYSSWLAVYFSFILKLKKKTGSGNGAKTCSRNQLFLFFAKFCLNLFNLFYLIKI